MNKTLMAIVTVSVMSLTTASLLGGEPSNTRQLPQTPADLLHYLPGTVWQVESNEEGIARNIQHAKGTLTFCDKGRVVHVYANDTSEDKHWGVTSDMRLVWGGKVLRVLTFSDDFTSFKDSLFETTGKRLCTRSCKNETK